MNKIKLFCIPHAGGSSMVYYTLRNYLEDSIELTPIELAGRGTRYGEKLYCNLNDAVNDLFNSIKDKLDQPFAILGHSMGSWMAYELYYKIFEELNIIPEHLFLSGNSAPYVKKTKKVLHTLDDDNFKKEIVKLGRTPKEIFSNEELCEIFLPVLRMDYKIIETYVHETKKRPIECGITVMNGKDDDITKDQLYAWEDCTNKSFEVINFEGDHFFIFNEFQRVGSIINTILLKQEKNILKTIT